MEISPEYIKELRVKIGKGRIYAGIDWGQDSTNSYTTMCLGTYVDGFFKVFFWHRFMGAESEPKEQIKKIKKIISTFNVFRVGVDYGGGFWPNDELLRAFGSRRVVRYQYSTPKVHLDYDPKLGRFKVHRSEVMSAVFNAIKRKTVFKFPRWQDFASPFASDMTSIFSEYNERTRMTDYKKAPNTTDDSFHTLVFCFLASMVDHPREDVFLPSARIDRTLFDSRY